MFFEFGFGSGFVLGIGYGGFCWETFFVVGLKDVVDADMDKIEKIIFDVFECIFCEGFLCECVEVVMY